MRMRGHGKAVLWWVGCVEGVLGGDSFVWAHLVGSSSTGDSSVPVVMSVVWFSKDMEHFWQETLGPQVGNDESMIDKPWSVVLKHSECWYPGDKSMVPLTSTIANPVLI